MSRSNPSLRFRADQLREIIGKPRGIGLEPDFTDAETLSQRNFGVHLMVGDPFDGINCRHLNYFQQNDRLNIRVGMLEVLLDKR